MVSKILSAATIGIEARQIEIEVGIAGDLPLESIEEHTAIALQLQGDKG